MGTSYLIPLEEKIRKEVTKEIFDYPVGYFKARLSSEMFQFTVVKLY